MTPTQELRAQRRARRRAKTGPRPPKIQAAHELPVHAINSSAWARQSVDWDELPPEATAYLENEMGQYRAFVRRGAMGGHRA